MTDLQTKLEAALGGVTAELSRRGISFQLAPPASKAERTLALVAGEPLEVVARAETGTPPPDSPGRVRILVGPYGARKQFPERRQMPDLPLGFDFVKIADVIEEYQRRAVKERPVKRAREAKKRALLDAAASIRSEVGTIPGVALAVEPLFEGLTVEVHGLAAATARRVMGALKTILA